MDNLTFEFMERIKNIPIPTQTTQSLYRLKTILTWLWVIVGVFCTSFLFVDRLLLFFFTGILLMLALSSPRRPFSGRWEQIFTLSVVYCLLPFYTPMSVYVLSAVLSVLLMEFFFVSLNGYFLNAAVVILCLMMSIFPRIFISPQLESFFFIPKDPFFFLYSFFTSSSHIPLYKELLSPLLGLFLYFPAGSWGWVGLLFFCLPFVPRIVYRGAFSYILALCILSYMVVFYKSGNILAYESFLSDLFAKSGMIFVALFVIPETLGNPTRSRMPVVFAVVNALCTVLFYILVPSLLLSAIWGVLITFLIYYLVESLYWNKQIQKDIP